MIRLLRKVQVIFKSDNTGLLTTKLYIDSKTANTTVSTLPSSADIRHYGRGVRNLISVVNKTVESFKLEFSLTGCEERPRLIGWGILINPLHDWRNAIAVTPATGLEVEEGIGLDVGRLWAQLSVGGGNVLRTSSTNVLITDYGENLGLEVEGDE